jgi:hypothetical protein
MRDTGIENIRLAGKKFAGTNALAYFDAADEEESHFIRQH